VELTRQADRIVAPSVPVRVVFLLEMTSQTVNIGVTGALDGKACNPGLQQQARFEDGGRLFRRGRGDESAAVGAQLHNLAAREEQKSAPDPHPARAEGLAQSRFGQLRSRRQALVNDRLENALDDCVLGSFVTGGAGIADWSRRCQLRAIQ
jgi:hypothetical protein